MSTKRPFISSFYIYYYYKVINNETMTTSRRVVGRGPMDADNPHSAS